MADPPLIKAFGGYAAALLRYAQAPLCLSRGWERSPPRQRQLGAQAPDRRRAQREHAAVEAGQLDHDRQTEAGAGLGLVKPGAAQRHLLALAGRQARPVVVDDDAHPRLIAVVA